MTIPQRVVFPELVAKPVVASVDREQASSDGGAVVLVAAERVYGLVEGLPDVWSTSVRRRRCGARSKA